MNIFEALHESHTLQRKLCKRLLRSETGSKREATFQALKVELHAHAAAEERFLYVPMLLDDSGLNSSRHALHEHHQIDELLEDLSIRNKSGPTWMKNAHALSDKVHHHLKEEEHKFFKVAGRIIAERKKSQLGAKYLKELARLRKKLSTP